MRGHLLVVGAAGLFLAAAAAVAEPAKAPVQKVSQPADRPAEVVIASVDTVRPPATAGDQGAAAPAKKVRRARVISCRCGDPAAQD